MQTATAAAQEAATSRLIEQNPNDQTKKSVLPSQKWIFPALISNFLLVDVHLATLAYSLKIMIQLHEVVYQFLLPNNLSLECGGGVILSIVGVTAPTQK
jgi:hypothetical protein